MTRYAAIDVGSNAARLVIAKIDALGEATLLYRNRYPLPLGRDVFAAGKITAENTSALVAAFEHMATKLNRHRVDAYRAVATAAMREAANGAQLARKIKREASISLEIIGGDEEASLAHEALIRAVGCAPPESLLLDLGGGSLEIGRVRGGRRLSLPLGSVRLLKLYPALGAPLSEKGLGAILEDLQRRLNRFTRSRTGASYAIGTGGNLKGLARLCPNRRLLHPAIGTSRLRGFIKTLSALSGPERARRFDLRPDRAESIVADATVALALSQRFAIKNIVVPNTGIREGLLHQLCAASWADVELKEWARQRAAPLRPLAARAALCQQLFVITSGQHQLWPPALEPLITAAYLGRLRPHGSRAEASENGPVDFQRRAEGLSIDRILKNQVAQIEEARFRGLSSPKQETKKALTVLSYLLELASSLQERGATRIQHANALDRAISIRCNLKSSPPQKILARAPGILGCSIRISAA